MGLFYKRNFRLFVFRRSLLFAAFTKRRGDEKKSEGEKQSTDIQELTFNLLIAAKDEIRGRAGFIGG
jgi:hypothetical protein